MPYVCCVLSCRENYSEDPKVHVIAFPLRYRLVSKVDTCNEEKKFYSIKTKQSKLYLYHHSENYSIATNDSICRANKKTFLYYIKDKF